MGTPGMIMIVEDSPTQALQLQFLLENHGYRVAVARDGMEAIELLNHDKPLLVISDILMPNMDGYQMCSHIKESDALKDIAVILLTTLSQPQDILKGLQSRADRFLTKPCDEGRLLSTIGDILRPPEVPPIQETPEGIEINYGGQTCIITSKPSQILDLLITTYETAIEKNAELIATRDELALLNKVLEEKVRERTEALIRKNEELKTISQQLWQAAKLATMGELAASIAHELNNPLATVSLRTELLLAQLAEDDAKVRELRIIETEVERMGSLVANLLEFSRHPHRQISTVSIQEEMEGTMELIHYHLAKRNIQVERIFAEDIPKLHADRQLLRQVFLNLFTNAADAMPHGGILTMHLNMNSPLDTHVVIEISDTGVGIAPEDLPRVMEPFFTTKPEGKGTGLGLPICRRVVQECGGALDIDSELGKGTTVRLMLPVSNSGGVGPKC